MHKINDLCKIELKRKSLNSISVRRLSSSRYNVLFFGTDEFSLGGLKVLNSLRLEGRFIEKLKVCSFGQPNYIKRKKQLVLPPVLQYAEKYRLPQLSWKEMKKDKKLDGVYDIAVVSSFGDFIPSKIISQFSRSAINIHPSLLPRWRGAAPLFHTILSGDDVTGVSFIELSESKFDVGKILLQEKFTVPPSCTIEQLTDSLAVFSGKLLPNVIENIDYFIENAKAQDDNLATYAPKYGKHDGFIDFDKYNIAYVERLQRALPEKIGIKASWEEKHVKFGKIKLIKNLVSQEFNYPNGFCRYNKTDDLLEIKLKDGWISINDVQVQNKKVNSPKNFYNGYMVNKESGLLLEEHFKKVT